MRSNVARRILVLGICVTLAGTMLFGCGRQSAGDSHETEGETVADGVTTDGDVSDESVSDESGEKKDDTTGDLADTQADPQEHTPEGEQTKEDPVAEPVEEDKDGAVYCAAQFKGMKRTMPYKLYGEHNPVMTQAFGADPYALVYDDTVYLYMTGDVLETSGGTVGNNTFGKINTLHIVKSKDLVNWTDCGEIKINGSKGVTKWANNSWAPAICMKNIDGKDQFFLYFANGGGGIGVLVADSPEGPFTDPLGKALVTWSSPGVPGVVWLFDPAVFVDDDGTGYLYFGGGVPEGKQDNPGTGRVVKLTDDMIHLDGEAKALEIPYLFEDSGINKIGDTYYYSYCSNWNVPSMAESGLPIESAQICYMTSKSPMGPFELQGTVLRNPGAYFGIWGTNHHCMFEFRGQYYIAYHSQVLEKKMGYEGKGYRCTHIDKVTVNEDGSLSSFGTTTGVEQVCNFSLEDVVEAETMSTMGGIEVVKIRDSKAETGERMVVSAIETGDFIFLSNVNFAQGKNHFRITARSGNEDGFIEIRLDTIGGPVVGYVRLAGETEGFQEFECDLLETVTGVHNLLFTFCGEGFTLDKWCFE